METLNLLVGIAALSAFLFYVAMMFCDEQEHRLKFYAGALLFPIIIGSIPSAKHLFSEVAKYGWTVVYDMNHTVGEFLTSLGYVSISSIFGVVASVMLWCWLRDPIYGR